MENKCQHKYIVGIRNPIDLGVCTKCFDTKYFVNYGASPESKLYPVFVILASEWTQEIKKEAN